MNPINCTRDLTPETCVFCEMEGMSYCTYCADNFNGEEKIYYPPDPYTLTNTYE